MTNRNHKNFKGALISLLIAVLISIPVPTSASENTETPPMDMYYLEELMKVIQTNYVYDITEEELIEGAVKGLFYSIDPNSSYYTKEEFQQLMESTAGDFVGIGIYITEVDGNIEVDPIEDSPAYDEGLKSGDIILEVDEKDVEGLSIEEVSDLIKGEEGTKVKLKIQRGSKNLIYNITRKLVQVNPIDYSVLDNGIGYIGISEFNQHTYENLEKVLDEFDDKDVKDIIMDLRNNPGGLLMEAVRSLKLFIPEGPIVHIRYKDDIEQTYYSTLKRPKYNLVVLMNEYSASASEIFAGAVQDTSSGTIIGVPSYGKGTVQIMMPLPYGDGMKLTIAEYLTPKRRNINDKGIIPDIKVINNSRTKDIQLQKAVDLLTK
ncbi:PDZ domain-containing protein [Schnuerera sp. xch1]|uniref:S41 family peptidase n=1 Tax=Schnuerera sp. xch1 TaxID=2874283 RepID=UPI001CBB785F|nr:S41 family peptidase [Schnuerera sp. xch1]MBZ2175123.1 PDZ domain-containing protein [Schnuerera sp. xch1]